MVLGSLAFKSGFIPKWLAVLLMVASIGYIVDSFGRFRSPGSLLSLAQFTFVGEALLIFWRGVKGFENAPEESHDLKPDWLHE